MESIFIKSPLNAVSEDFFSRSICFLFFLQVSSELPIGSSAASTSAIKKKIQAKMAGGGGASPASASQTGVSPVQVSPEQMAANKAAFLEKVRLSNAACQAGDFSQVWLLTQSFSFFHFVKTHWFAWRANQWPLIGETQFSSFPPSNSLVSVFDHWRHTCEYLDLLEGLRSSLMRVFWFLTPILSAFCTIPNHTASISNLLSCMGHISVY